MKASKVFLGMKLKKSCEHTVVRNCLLDKALGLAPYFAAVSYTHLDVYKRQGELSP